MHPSILVSKCVYFDQPKNHQFSFFFFFKARLLEYYQYFFIFYFQYFLSRFIAPSLHLWFVFLSYLFFIIFPFYLSSLHSFLFSKILTFDFLILSNRSLLGATTTMRLMGALIVMNLLELSQWWWGWCVAIRNLISYLWMEQQSNYESLLLGEKTIGNIGI